MLEITGEHENNRLVSLDAAVSGAAAGAGRAGAVRRAGNPAERRRGGVARERRHRHPGGSGLGPASDEKHRRRGDETRLGDPQGEHRPLDGRRADVQHTGFRQAVRPRDPLHGIVPRHGSVAYAGDVERHAHQQPDAGHDRLFDDPLLFHRRRLAAPRNLVDQRDGRRTGRTGETLDCAGGGRRIRAAIYPGHRHVPYFRRIPAPDMGRRALAGINPRRLPVLGQRLQVPQPRQEGEHLRRRDEHRRVVLSHRTQQERRVRRRARVAGGLLQHRERRPLRAERLVHQFQPGTAPADDRLRRRHAVRKPPARTHPAQRPLVGPLPPELEGGGESRIRAFVDGLRLPARQGQRHPGGHDPFAEQDQHPLRAGRRGVFRRRQMVLHGRAVGTPALRRKRRQEHHPPAGRQGRRRL